MTTLSCLSLSWGLWCLNRFPQDIQWNGNNTKTRTQHSDCGESNYGFTHSRSNCWSSCGIKSTASTPQSVQCMFVFSVHTLACTCVCVSLFHESKGRVIRWRRGCGSPAVRGGGLEEESFSCSEGSRDPPSSKHFHSERRSMKRQERTEGIKYTVVYFNMLYMLHLITRYRACLAIVSQNIETYYRRNLTWHLQYHLRFSTVQAVTDLRNWAAMCLSTDKIPVILDNQKTLLSQWHTFIWNYFLLRNSPYE